ncbi:MAG: hypothetical protein QOD85_1614, partial [Gaiellaceae bacterium]|nr:hypothetical protein [Gaiellaceae bacterium]
MSNLLVGRNEETAVLDRVLDAVDAGLPASLEIAGEAGIGKSRLLSELAARADRRNLLVLAGSGSEFERDLPFSVFVDALDDYLRALDPGRLEELSDEVRAELAHVFPSLPVPAALPSVTDVGERYRSHRAVRALLEELARRLPVVLVLDDLHWADSASIELVAALLRRPPAAGVAIAFAVRPRLVSDGFAASLERAGREGDLQRIELGGLTLAEVQELLTGSPGRNAVDLYEESGGNPFYVEQLARHRGDHHGGAGSAELSATGIPPAVAASLGEEIALLSPNARLVLEGAAVAGDPFEPELAASAASVSEEAAMDGIDELLRFDLVRSTDVPRRFRFRHPLVRNALYEATAAGWRLGAHERCAAALAAHGAAATARAHHVERSARNGDHEAIRLLTEAGRESLRLAPASAAHWFSEALRLLPHTAAASERIELLRARSDALTATGHYAASHDALLEALE